MTKVCYIAPDALDADEHVHAYLRVDDTVHIVPALPEVELHPNDLVYFNGPLMGALYGGWRGTSLSPRTKGLILSTLARNPDYFKRLGARIRATNSMAPIATIVPAVMKKKGPKGVTKHHK